MKNEVTNYLLAYEHMTIIQRTDMFTFSLDTVLLAHFAQITKGVDCIVDFGTNNAAIPLILSTRTKKKIIGVEIQEEAVELAKRNIAINHLEDQVEIVHDDIKHFAYVHKPVKLIVCNPPFFKLGERSNVNESKYLTIARHETMITLEEIIKCASHMLENSGRLAMVYRPDRLIETMNLMQKYDIEPKRLRLVYPKMGRNCNTFLIEGVKKGRTGLTIEAPLYTHKEDNHYTDEIHKYFGEKNV